MKNFGKYLLGENIRAALVALALILIPDIGLIGLMLSGTVLGFVTLRKGAKSGLVILAFVMIPMLAFLIARQNYNFENSLRVFAFLVIDFVIALILRRTNQWRWVFQGLAALGAIITAVIYFTVPHIIDISTQLLIHMMKTQHIVPLDQLNDISKHQAVIHFAPIFLGMMVSLVSVFLSMALILARFWETSIFSPGQFKKEFLSLHLHPLSSVILLAATIGLFSKAGWLYEIYPVLLVPFMFAGLSIIHRLVAIRKKWVFLLVLTYLLLVFLLWPVAIVALTAIGFIDSVVNLRKRTALLRMT